GDWQVDGAGRLIQENGPTCVWVGPVLQQVTAWSLSDHHALSCRAGLPGARDLKPKLGETTMPRRDPEPKKAELAALLRKRNKHVAVASLLEEGFFNEWNGDLDRPILMLSRAFQNVGDHAMAKRIQAGEFDDEPPT